MDGSANAYSVSAKSGRNAWLAGALRRAPLIMLTVIFTIISLRYLIQRNPSASVPGIIFTSPAGIAMARIAFAAFPLSLAILAFGSLVFARWRLAGLWMVLTVDSVVILTRLLGFLLDQSMATARLLTPELVLLAITINAIRLEWLPTRKEGQF